MAKGPYMEEESKQSSVGSLTFVMKFATLLNTGKERVSMEIQYGTDPPQRQAEELLQPLQETLNMFPFRVLLEEGPWPQ